MVGNTSHPPSPRLWRDRRRNASSNKFERRARSALPYLADGGQGTDTPYLYQWRRRSTRVWHRPTVKFERRARRASPYLLLPERFHGFLFGLQVVGVEGEQRQALLPFAQRVLFIADGLVRFGQRFMVEDMFRRKGDGDFVIGNGVGGAGDGQLAVNDVHIGAREDADVGDGVVPSAQQVPGDVLFGVEMDGDLGLALEEARVHEAGFGVGKLAFLAITDGQGGVGEGVLRLGFDGVLGAGQRAA